MKTAFLNLFAVIVIVFGLMAITASTPATSPHLASAIEKECCTAANGAKCCGGTVCSADATSCKTKKCSLFRRIFGSCEAE